MNDNRTIHDIIKEELMLLYKLDINIVEKLLLTRSALKFNHLKKKISLNDKITGKLLKKLNENQNLVIIKPQEINAISYSFDFNVINKKNPTNQLDIKKLDKNKHQNELINDFLCNKDNKMDKWLVYLYNERIPPEGINKNKLRNNSHFFKNKAYLLDLTLNQGEKLGLFKICEKENKSRAKKSFLIYSLKNEKNSKYISKLEEKLEPQNKEETKNKKIKTNLRKTQELWHIIQRLYDYLEIPRKAEEINHFVNEDLNYKYKNVGLFNIESINMNFNLSDKIRSFFKLLVIKSFNSNYYLRRDIIIEKSDKLGFLIENENIYFHFARGIQIFEVLAHVLKYGFSKNLFEIFNKILKHYKDYSSFRISWKRNNDNKNGANRNLFQIKKVKYSTNTMILVLSKFHDVSKNQENAREFFWLSKFENQHEFLKFIRLKILYGGIIDSASIKRTFKKHLLSISAKYRVYSKDMKVKKEFIKDYKKISSKFACCYIQFGTRYIFFDREIDYVLVNGKIEEISNKFISSVRKGMMNGKPAFLKLVKFFEDNIGKENIIDYGWTHGKKITKLGGLKIPIKKFGRIQYVEADGFIIYTINNFKYLALVQHKDGSSYTKSDCQDLISATEIDRMYFIKYPSIYHKIEDVNFIEAIFLVRDNNEITKSYFEKINNFRLYTYDDIDYNPIDETNFNCLELSNLQYILNQSYKDSDVNLKEIENYIDKLDEKNIIEFKYNGICAAVTVDGKGNVKCGIKNSKTKVILPDNYIKQFSVFLNSSFKIELMFNSFKTWRKFRVRTNDNLLNLDSDAMKNDFFIVITDIFCLFNQNYFLSDATERRFISEKVFLDNKFNLKSLFYKESSTPFRFLYEKDPLKYNKHCAKNNLLMIPPGLIFKKTESGIERLTQFCQKYFFLIEFPFNSFYYNLDGMIIKTDRYDLYSRHIYNHHAIKIKTNQTFSLLLWAAKKSNNPTIPSGGRGLFVARLPSKNGDGDRYFPVGIANVKKEIAAKDDWTVLSEPIIIECALRKPLFSNTVGSIKKIGIRPNAKIDEIMKIIKTYKISKNVIQTFNSIINSWNFKN